MAKRKKTEAKFVLPKQLAGVKIPKALREQGHHLAELARHPLVKEIVAAGLVALAAAVRESKSGAVAKVKKKVGDVADAAAAAATETLTQGTAVKETVAKAARKASTAAPRPAAKAAAPKPAAKAAAPKPATKKPAAKTAAKPAAAKSAASKPAAKAPAAKPTGSLPPPPPRTPRTRRTSPSKTTH